MNIRLLQIGFLSYLGLVGLDGCGDVGLYTAASKIPAPNIDDLGRRGVWLTDGHAASATCTPSRYPLMTVRYAWRTRLTAGVLMLLGEPLLEEQEQTVGDPLKSVGYSTGLVGKWHLEFHWPWRDGARPADAQILPSRWISEARNDQFDWSKPLLGGPTDAGFDYYFGDDVPNFPPYAWIENDRIVADGLVDLPRSALISTGFSGGIHGSCPDQPGWQLDQVVPMLVEKSVACIQTHENAAQPFFLMVSLTSPHAPIVPTEEFDGTS